LVAGMARSYAQTVAGMARSYAQTVAGMARSYAQTVAGMARSCWSAGMDGSICMHGPLLLVGWHEPLDLRAWPAPTVGAGHARDPCGLSGHEGQQTEAHRQRTRSVPATRSST
jgi:hypothetical protein